VVYVKDNRKVDRLLRIGDPNGDTNYRNDGYTLDTILDILSDSQRPVPSRSDDDDGKIIGAIKLIDGPMAGTMIPDPRNPKIIPPGPPIIPPSPPKGSTPPVPPPKPTLPPHPAQPDFKGTVDIGDIEIKII
jgi:hypothetical protein